MRRVVKSFFFPTLRGRLRYPTLNAFVDDVAEAATINKPLPGGEDVNYYWWDQYFFAQDEWRMAQPDAEPRPALRAARQQHRQPGRAERAASCRRTATTRSSRFSPVPKRDTNNFQPRLGFNWNAATRTTACSAGSPAATGSCVRGGYARTHDYAFLNIALNIASSFPYVAAINRSTWPTPSRCCRRPRRACRSGTDPNQLTRTIVAEDFRSPLADQFSLELQRQMGDEPRASRRATWARSATISSRRSTATRGSRSQHQRVGSRRAASFAFAPTPRESWYDSLQIAADKRFSGA